MSRGCWAGSTWEDSQHYDESNDVWNKDPAAVGIDKVAETGEN